LRKNACRKERGRVQSLRLFDRSVRFWRICIIDSAVKSNMSRIYCNSPYQWLNWFARSSFQNSLYIRPALNWSKLSYLGSGALSSQHSDCLEVPMPMTSFRAHIQSLYKLSDSDLQKFPTTPRQGGKCGLPTRCRREADPSTTNFPPFATAKNTPSYKSRFEHPLSSTSKGSRHLPLQSPNWAYSFS
jgi:hypothetical protein